MSNSANVKLTPAAILDNLAEKVGVSTESGMLCIVCVQLEACKVTIIRSNKVSTIQGFLMY